MLRRVVTLALFATIAAPAVAIKPFQDQFLEKYADGTDPAFTELAKDAKCWVCHQGKSKKNHNPYGQAVHKLLHKKDAKDVDKIIESLDKVAAMSSDPDDPDAPTFGELIAEGKLPGGTLEEAKAEPTEE